jgi:hypothetical protein
MPFLPLPGLTRQSIIFVKIDECAAVKRRA